MSNCFSFDLRAHLITQHNSQLRKLKANSYLCGNKAGKLLAKQLKEKIVKQKILYIKNPKTGLKVTNPKDIADTFSDYFEALYNLKNYPDTHQPTDKTIFDFLTSVNLPIIPQLNQPFKVTEIEKIFRSLPHNKSPGPDGYTSEYYQLFSSNLSPYLMQFFDATMSNASFPLEMLMARIITLPKSAKDPNMPPNFRPISLLNVDVKVYAKLLTNRLTNLLPKLINHDQVGFVSEPQILPEEW